MKHGDLSTATHLGDATHSLLLHEGTTMTLGLGLLGEVVDLLRERFGEATVARMLHAAPEGYRQIRFWPPSEDGDTVLFYRFHDQHPSVELFIEGTAFYPAGRDMDGFTASELVNIAIETLRSGFTLELRSCPFIRSRITHFTVRNSPLELSFDVPLLVALFGKASELGLRGS